MIKCTRHEEFALRALKEVADNAQIWSGEKITVDHIIRLSVYKFLARGKDYKINKETIKKAAFDARNACEN
jgi:hypothetical protein